MLHANDDTTASVSGSGRAVVARVVARVLGPKLIITGSGGQQVVDAAWLPISGSISKRATCRPAILPIRCPQFSPGTVSFGGIDSLGRRSTWRKLWASRSKNAPCWRFLQPHMNRNPETIAETHHARLLSLPSEEPARNSGRSRRCDSGGVSDLGLNLSGLSGTTIRLFDKSLRCFLR